MTVEVATYVADLQPANPPGTDPQSQGDDHLRLIKQVLQNTFGGASRAWQIPGAKAVSVSYSVVKTDGESVIYVATAGGVVTLTLPTLVAADAGWKVWFCKTSSDANPIFVAPPTGTINSGGVAGLSKARRCIPGVTFAAIWDGANWFTTRCLALPIGSCIEFHGSVLPAGFEWPNGQTLVSGNYPEYYSRMGSGLTLDKRGYTSICLDNLGGTSAGRLPSGIIIPTAVGNTGGADSVTLNTTQIPAHQHNVYLHDPGHVHSLPSGYWLMTGTVYNFASGGTQGGPASNPNVLSSGTGITIGSVSGVANDNLTTSVGGGGSHSNLQPSVMVSQILVVE